MKTASKVYTALIFIFLYAPIIVLIIFSFNDTDTASRTQFSGFTLRWYQRLFEDRYILEALLNTLIIAVVSAFASTVLGTMAAVGINRMKRMPKKVMMNITNFPMVNPEIVTGVSMMLLFVAAVSLFGGKSLGMASLEEIRDAVLRFRQSGKWVIGYSDYYTQASYYMSTAAEKVYLNPEGGVEWVGLASGVLFYKGLLDKMDLQPEVIRHGEFKAAVEPFITDRMSPANRLQMERLLGSIWGHVVRNVASARGIDSTDLQRYASELTLADGESAVRTKMVDSLAYAADMERMLCERTGADDEPRYISLAEYVDQPKEPIKKLSKNHIAVVYAEGQIVDGKGREGLVGGNSLAARLADVRRDDRVKAVVLRVNSPGGSALASEVIWHEIEQLRQERPVIVSMGNVAASGGYYISCPADAIMASPVTLTGSIGVFGLMFNGEQTLRDKLGITVDVAKTNPSADLGMTVFGAVGVRPLSSAERQFMQNGVERVYETFVGHVAEGRNMSVAAVDSIGGGRVWSGIDAVRIGLVDGFGGLREAIALAADRAGVAGDFRIVTPADELDPLSQVLRMMSAESRAELFKGEFGEIYSQYEMLQNILGAGGVQAIMPYDVRMR